MVFITVFVILSIGLTLVFGIALVMAAMDDTDRDDELEDEEQQQYLEKWAERKNRRKK